MCTHNVLMLDHLFKRMDNRTICLYKQTAFNRSMPIWACLFWCICEQVFEVFEVFEELFWRTFFSLKNRQSKFRSMNSLKIFLIEKSFQLIRVHCFLKTTFNGYQQWHWSREDLIKDYKFVFIWLYKKSILMKTI